MTTKSTTSKGVKLQRGNGAGTEIFATIGEVFNISGPNESVEEIEVTSFDSTAKEYLPGLRDGGEVQFDFRLVGEDAMQVGLRSDFAAGVVRNFKLELNDATATLTTPSVYAFAAVVKALGTTFGTNAPVNCSCTLKVSGAVTFTARHAP